MEQPRPESRLRFGSLQYVVDSLLQMSPGLRVFSLLEAPGKIEGPAVAVATAAELAAEPSRVESLQQGGAARAILMDAPMDELRARFGLELGLSERIIFARPIARASRCAPAAADLDALIVYRANGDARRARSATRFFEVAASGGFRSVEAGISEASEASHLVQRLKPESLCVDATDDACLMQALWSLCAQLGLRFASFWPQAASPFRLGMDHYADPSRLLVSGRRHAPTIKELARAFGFWRSEPIQALQEDPVEAEARRILRRLESMDGAARRLAPLRDSVLARASSFGGFDRWPQSVEDVKAAWELADAVAAEGVHWSVERLASALEPIFARLANAPNEMDWTAFFQVALLGDDRVWREWLRWLATYEPADGEGPSPGRDKSVAFAQRLCAPSPLEANWSLGFRKAARGKLAKGVSLARCLGERAVYRVSASYLEVRCGIFLGEGEAAAIRLEERIEAFGCGDAYLEPFVLDFWFCGHRAIATAHVERLAAIGATLAAPVLLSSLLAAATTRHDAAFRHLETVRQSRGIGFELMPTSPAHQALWRCLAGRHVALDGPALEPVREALQSLAPNDLAREFAERIVKK